MESERSPGGSWRVTRRISRRDAFGERFEGEKKSAPRIFPRQVSTHEERHRFFRGVDFVEMDLSTFIPSRLSVVRDVIERVPLHTTIFVRIFFLRGKCFEFFFFFDISRALVHSRLILALMIGKR